MLNWDPPLCSHQWFPLIGIYNLLLLTILWKQANKEPLLFTPPQTVPLCRLADSHAQPSFYSATYYMCVQLLCEFLTSALFSLLFLSCFLSWTLVSLFSDPSAPPQLIPLSSREEFYFSYFSDNSLDPLRF